MFFKLIAEEFSANLRLLEIFNRNVIKLSYSKVKQAIYSHNQKLLSANKPERNESDCSCRNKNTCPLLENFLAKSVMYQASVTTTNNSKAMAAYVELTKINVKTKYSSNKSTFDDTSKCHTTELSSYIWDPKESKTDYHITW